MNKHAKKLADVFSDERINPLELASQTAFLFTPSMTARLHQFLRWHSHKTNGYQTELPEINLDNNEEIG